MSNVENPNHYTDKSSLTCWEVMRLIFTPHDIAAFCKINAFKYLWRHKFKNGEEDLHKAQWYLNKLVDVDEKLPFEAVQLDLLQRFIDEAYIKIESENQHENIT